MSYQMNSNNIGCLKSKARLVAASIFMMSIISSVTAFGETNGRTQNKGPGWKETVDYIVDQMRGCGQSPLYLEPKDIPPVSVTVSSRNVISVRYASSSSLESSGRLERTITFPLTAIKKVSSNGGVSLQFSGKVVNDVRSDINAKGLYDYFTCYRMNAEDAKRLTNAFNHLMDIPAPADLDPFK